MMVAVETVTIPGVELVRVGSWAGTIDGKPAEVKVTEADLADAVAAAQDAEVDAAPLKVGHKSKVFGDGAPALGWVTNLRLADNGRRLVGDLKDVPAKFATLMPKAFRRRSAELAYGVRTPSGKRYRLTVTALSVLGVSPPAVKGLADLEALYGLGEGSIDAERTAVALSAGDLDATAVANLDAAIAALDGLNLDDATRARLAAELEDAAGVADATIPPPAKVPGQDGPNGTGTTEETPAMPIDEKRIRELIGAAEDADLEKELEALKAKATGTSDDGKPAGTGDDGKPAEGDPAASDAGELVGAGALSASTLAELKKAGVTVVSDDLLEELRAPAVQLAEARRAEVLNAAIAAGKITPAEAGEFATGDKPATGFAALLTSAEEQTTALLGAMAPKYPVVELGAANGADASDDAAFTEFEASLGLDVATAGD